MSDASASRLYLLLPQRLEPETFAARLEEVLAAVSVACVRLDLGQASEADWTRAANHLIGPCHAADVALVVTDHYQLVEPLGLDGVHLAGSRVPVREVRKRLGKNRIVGAYAAQSKHNGMTIAEAGADYVSFGPVGATGMLGDDARVDDDLFAWWAEMIETPCVAEGGVTAQDAERLSPIADFVTPELRIWETEDPAAVLRAFSAALA